MDIESKVGMPAPTPWPMVLALGLTLVAAGLVTAASVGILGAVLALAGGVGWFRQVLPVEAHEWTSFVPEEIAIETSRKTVECVLGAGSRAWLPLAVHPVSAGVKGGVAGGAVMALLAAAYGMVSGNGIWYAMNLLVEGMLPAISTQTSTELTAFHIYRLLAALPIHLLISLLVGLLYGTMLPMLPRHPVLLGGFVAPLLWSGLIGGGLTIINPVMKQHIHWVWFVASQIGFGVVAGIVVSAHDRIPTRQNVPLVVRMGIEASGLSPLNPEDPRQ